MELTQLLAAPSLVQHQQSSCSSPSMGEEHRDTMLLRRLGWGNALALSGLCHTRPSAARVTDVLGITGCDQTFVAINRGIAV